MNAVRILSAVLALAAAPALAGTAEVRFGDPHNYADAGFTHRDQMRNLEELARHLERLAQRLPAGHTLRVDVVDVDLAGTQFGLGPRVVRHQADIPRLHLRYSVDAGGRVMATGEDFLSRLDYARTLPSTRTPMPLDAEKQMLDDWFAQRFAAPAHAAR